MLDKRSETWITCHETLLRRRLVILFNPFFIFLLQTKKKTTTTTNQNSKGIRESFFSFLSTTYGSINSKTKRTSYTENKMKKTEHFVFKLSLLGQNFFSVCVCAFFMYLYLVNTHKKWLVVLTVVKPLTIIARAISHKTIYPCRSRARLRPSSPTIQKGGRNHFGVVWFSSATV